MNKSATAGSAVKSMYRPGLMKLSHGLSPLTLSLLNSSSPLAKKMRQRYQVPDPNTSHQTEFDRLSLNAYPSSSLNRSSTSLELERSSPTIFPARRRLLFPHPVLPRDLSLVDADDPFDSAPIRRSPLSLDISEDDEVPGTFSPNGGTFTPLSPVSLGAYAKFKNWTFPSQNLHESSFIEYRVGDPFAFDHKGEESFVFGGVEVDDGGNDHVSAFSDVFVWQSPGLDTFSDDVTLRDPAARSDVRYYSPRSSRMGLEIERGDMHVEDAFGGAVFRVNFVRVV